MDNIYCHLNTGLFSTFVKLLSLHSPLLMLHFHLLLIPLLNPSLLDQRAMLNQNPILPLCSVPNLSNLIRFCFCPYFSKSYHLPEHMQSFLHIHSSLPSSVPLSQMTSVAPKSHTSLKSLPTIPPYWQLDKFWVIRSHWSILAMSCTPNLPTPPLPVVSYTQTLPAAKLSKAQHLYQHTLTGLINSLIY